jgi:hypothetical protein
MQTLLLSVADAARDAELAEAKIMCAFYALLSLTFRMSTLSPHQRVAAALAVQEADAPGTLAERQLRATEVRQRSGIEAAADKSRAETEAILKERCCAGLHLPRRDAGRARHPSQ